MKKNFLATMFVALGVMTLFINADHLDAPAVSGSSADVTDFYAFQSADQSSIVFVAATQGFIVPTATGDASFDENILIEFNIDTDGNAVEDLVIQAIPRNNKMYVFGPMAPTVTGNSSTVMTGATQTVVDITAYGSAESIGTNGGIKVFAGPRDDPFFFDLGAYQAILGGTAGGFNDPGTDTFEGTNVMAIAVEVPKSMLGNSTDINAWVESKRKQ